MTPTERHIAALQRMGYEAGMSGYGDDYGLEMEGYTIFAPDGTIACERMVYALEDTTGEAWLTFLEAIGKANT